MKPLEISRDVSAKLVNLSFVCALLVVSIHVGSADASSPAAFWTLRIFKEAIGQLFAVPFFFAASGFFLAGHFAEKGWYKTEIAKRVRSLVVPYFVWTVLFAAIGVGASVIIGLLSGNSLLGAFEDYYGPLKTVVWQMTGLDLFHMPLMAQIWYLRALFCLVVVSPVFVYGLRLGRLFFMLFVFAFHLFLCSYLPLTTPWGEFARRTIGGGGIFYFVLGMAIRLGVVTSPGRIVSSGIAALGWGLMGGRVFFDINGLVQTALAPCALYAFWLLMPRTLSFKSVTSLSYPIFLLHTPVIAVWDMTMPILAKFGMAFSKGGLVLSNLFVGIVGSCLIARFLLRCLPRFANFCFSGRTRNKEI